MWIKFLIATKQAKIGEILPVADNGEVQAKTLIDAGICEECPEPENAATSAKGLSADLATIVNASVKSGFDQMRKDLAPAIKSLNVKDEGYELGTAKALKLPATARRFSTTKNFTGPNKDAKAYFFGSFCMAISNLPGRGLARKRLDEAGLNWRSPFGDDGVMSENIAGSRGKAAAENLNSDSAVLVPDEFGMDIIDLREKYGVFRANAKIVPMTSDRRTDPRRRNGVATYFVNEGAAGTQVDKTWDNVGLTAKKLMCLTTYSTEIAEDAMISIGDDLAEEFAYAMALKEDQCGFIGDATSTYGGIQGATTKLRAVSATVANILGLVVASGTGYASSYASITLADFNKVVGTLPEYAELRDPNCAWYVSKYFWGSVMQRLATAAGGNKVMDIIDGARIKSFLGYPVIISQVMPKTPAINQIVALFGSLKLSSSFGTRREIGISISNSAGSSFQQDQLMMRATERFDINVHDVGDSTTNIASSQAGAVAGPIVGLITAAS